MKVHKFGKKSVPLAEPSHPLTVHWIPKEVRYKPVKRSLKTWEIFAQETLVIQPREIKTIELNFGVHVVAGVILISLKQEIKLRKCSIRNETVLESVDNILIILENHSKEAVIINEGTPLCFVAMN